MNDDKIIDSVISDIEDKINDEQITVEMINSGNFSRRPFGKKVDMVIIHATMTNRMNDVVNHFCDPKSGVSTHYLIGRDGRTVQLVPESKAAWHIGKSYFNGRKNLNGSSIGIHLVGDIDIDFTNEQYSACAELCAGIISKYDIKVENIVGCEHVSGEYAHKLRVIKDSSEIRHDPGPKFNWKKLHDRYTMKFIDSEVRASLDEKEPDVYEDDTNRNRMYNPQALPRPVHRRLKILSLLGF